MIFKQLLGELTIFCINIYSGTDGMTDYVKPDTLQQAGSITANIHHDPANVLRTGFSR